MMPGTDAVRDRLEARLAALGARVERIEEAQREPLDDDLSEQAVAREDDEALDGIERAAIEDIAHIRQALARLDAGTYGQCVACGEVIAEARLDALPNATRCINCAHDADG
ncbi:TraR/DksA family transcriptional regulator [Sphingopyxis sp.]|jgi:RNA polymerase-binding transcription factor DksA|uniref:TraR/DksA family transcriptional regulator n=1 Tax=Sphingopyxis sp. TaxID=1908224 RepID=UPI0025CE3E46|nr:TraR/DksA family transcriptional regulator [Sphingopyxis sp.]